MESALSEKPKYLYVHDWPFPENDDATLTGYMLDSGVRLARFRANFAIRLSVPYGSNPYLVKIGDCHPVAMARIDGKWRPVEGLWPKSMDEWPELLAKMGYGPYMDGKKPSWRKSTAMA